MTTTILSERPITVDRFSRDDLVFKNDGDMCLKLKAFTSGTYEHGAVLVLLNEDGASRDSVTVEQQHSSVWQIDAAIEALTEARDVLRSMNSRT